MQKNSEIDKIEELSDNDLVKIIRDKNPDLYGEIVKRYRRKLFAYLYRLIGQKEEAEDLLQDVFIKVFKNLHSYDAERKFSSWIYRIAHNEAVNRIKRKTLRRFISLENITSTKDHLDLASSDDSAEELWIKKETKKEAKDNILEM